MPDSLWQAIGIAPSDDRDEIDRAYRTACLTEGPSDEMHYAWKLLRDPYYREMSETYESREAFKEAGFFDDGLDTELDEECYTDLAWLTTPYHKILSRICQLDEYDPAQLAAYPPIVLLTTGGFSPIHNGHIDMMELAKNEMFQQGHIVLGGYLSPSHDSYVSTKHDGSARLLDEQRIRLCHEAVALSEWLMVDPWEARYVPRAINYTDVILRLERYLNHQLPLPVPLRVGYVFGGDNAGFARAFLRAGCGVCIERPGYEAQVAAIKREIADATTAAGKAGDSGAVSGTVDGLSKTSAPKPCVVFARPRLEYFNISSSSIRSEAMDAMPDRSSRYYSVLRENAARGPTTIAERRYLIRDESSWAAAPWRTEENEADLEAATRAFLRMLAASLCETFEAPFPPDRPLALRIEVPTLDAQTTYADTLRRETETITLDACTGGSHRLEVSRLFGLADGQCFSTQVMPRPGYAPIAEQVAAIPPGEYALLDDDIASGRTMRMVIAVFPKGIRITRVLSLLEQTRSVDALRVDDIDYQDFYDVVDFRDFLFGSRNGGLVVRLPDRTIARVPYMAPYVTLNTRIRLPASLEVTLSLAMWRANERFHVSLRQPVLVADCDPASQKLMHAIGFAPSAPVLDVVRWHLRMLEQSTRRY